MEFGHDAKDNGQKEPAAMPGMDQVMDLKQPSVDEHSDRRQIELKQGDYIGDGSLLGSASCSALRYGLRGRALLDVLDVERTRSMALLCQLRAHACTHVDMQLLCT